MLTATAAPLTAEFVRVWRRLQALTRTTVRPHHGAFEHRHCNNISRLITAAKEVMFVCLSVSRKKLLINFFYEISGIVEHNTRNNRSDFERS